MSEHGIIQAIQILEEAVQSVPSDELPAILGQMERVKALGWSRMFTGPQSGQEELLLTIPQVAKRLKVSDYRTYELARQGILKSVRLGKKLVRVRPSAVEEYLAQEEA